MAGTPIAFKPDDVAVTGVDIYIKASALERILPITFKPEIDGLLLHLHALEKLPIQTRLDRLAQLRGLRPDTESTENSLQVPSPYRLFTMPGIDIQGDVGASFTAPKFTHSYDVRLAGDFLFTGFQGFLGADQKRPARQLPGDLRTARHQGRAPGPDPRHQHQHGRHLHARPADRTAQPGRARLRVFHRAAGADQRVQTASTCAAKCRWVTTWSSTSTTSCAAARAPR